MNNESSYIIDDNIVDLAKNINYDKITKDHVKVFLKCVEFVCQATISDLHYKKGHLFFEDGNTHRSTCKFYIDQNDTDEEWRNLYKCMSALDIDDRNYLCTLGLYDGGMNSNDSGDHEHIYPQQFKAKWEDRRKEYLKVSGIDFTFDITGIPYERDWPPAFYFGLHRNIDAKKFEEILCNHKE